MKVLVTGATGMIGSYLVRYLVQEGFRVKALRRATSDLSLLTEIEDKVEWITGDVLDVPSLEEAFDDVNKVYHVAALVTFNPAEKRKMFKVNVEGTANIVNMALSCKIDKLVHVSSVSAIGKAKEGAITEDTEWEDNSENTSYGLSKFLAETEVWRGIAEGLNAVIVNPSLVIGAGRWSDSSLQMFPKMASGQLFYPVGSTGYVDLRDVARIMLKLMESNISGERFIINAENLPYTEVLFAIADQLGVKKPTIPVRGWKLFLGQWFDFIKSKMTGVEPVFTREIATLTRNTYEYDNTKIREVLNYNFIPIRETIELTTEKYLESRNRDLGFATLPL